MHDTFLSIVCLIREGADLAGAIRVLGGAAKEQFADYELVLVDNAMFGSYKEQLASLPDDLRKHVAVVHLARRVEYDNAIVAGLDVANGDYVFVVDTDITAQTISVLHELYKKVADGNDIVYVKQSHERWSLRRRMFHWTFHKLMNRYSDVPLDLDAHPWRIVSRRALSAFLQVRETQRYSKAIWAYVGYKRCAIDAAVPDLRSRDYRFADQLRLAAIAITSFTNLASRALLVCFVVALLGCFAAITDVVLIKTIGVDLFGVPRQEVPGYGFLVVFSSIMFALLFLNLYFISLYVTSINREVKRRPVYLIETVERI